jgi:hypothetical protein
MRADVLLYAVIVTEGIQSVFIGLAGISLMSGLYLSTTMYIGVAIIEAAVLSAERRWIR